MGRRGEIRSPAALAHAMLANGSGFATVIAQVSLATALHAVIIHPTTIGGDAGIDHICPDTS
jgi:hypothetical protein